MDYYQGRIRTLEDYTRVLEGKSPLPQSKLTLADKDEDVKQILSEFSQVMASYKKTNADWWYGSLLNMKQQFMLGDMERESAPLEDKSVDIAMSCSIQPQSKVILMPNLI
ncbi:hypothetical protein [Serratia sp. 2723]|uniref:hypothetical protein n=1 Tax=unclassified Serratia (in: enterobacteria) TaxID=2647522 RepID=UPI003D21CB75